MREPSLSSRAFKSLSSFILSSLNRAFRASAFLDWTPLLVTHWYSYGIFLCLPWVTFILFFHSNNQSEGCPFFPGTLVRVLAFPVFSSTKLFMRMICFACVTHSAWTEISSSLISMTWVNSWAWMKGRTEKDYLILLGGLVRLGATPLARQGRREKKFGRSLKRLLVLVRKPKKGTAAVNGKTSA